MTTKVKNFLVSFFLILSLQNLYSQKTSLDTNFIKPPNIDSKILLIERSLVQGNLVLKLKLDDLDLIIQNQSFFKQSFSDFYLENYGISPADKNDIDNNLVFALQNTLHKEDPTISMIRKYLGISKDLLAIILAIIQLAKYY